MLESKPIARRYFFTRRIVNVLITAVACSALVFLFLKLDANLRHASYWSGYLLFASLLFLTAFNLRKKITFLPQIGSAAFWMQLHIYVGLSSVVVFGSHVTWSIPNGWLEGLLALLFVLVAGSGIYGLFITRLLPKRLTAVGDEVVFERIPALRLELAYQARQIAMSGLTSSSVVPKYYLNNLLHFFEKPRGIAYLFIPSGRKKRRLIGELVGLNRYLSQEQREITSQLAGFVQKKDDLDFHYAMQGRLKIWLFIHIGLTYSLILLSGLHAILVHAFIGGPV